MLLKDICSSLVHIGEQKPRRMVSQVTAVAKEAEIRVCRYIICLGSKVLMALMLQLPSVVLGGE